MNRLLLCLTVWSLLGNSNSADEPQLDAANLNVIPKRETGALDFLTKQPTFDGRDVVVAIFDSGVDPGAPGLRSTSTGATKVIDIIDGTGSGDVDCSKIQKAVDGRLIGFSGRSLKVSPSWINPSGQFHVGWKAAYEFFPGALVTRLKSERRKEFDKEQKTLVTKLRRQIAAFDSAKPKPKDGVDKAELTARLQQLLAAGKGFNDPGPVFDCVVFHDGKSFRASVDTDEDGDFSDEALLTNYRDENKYGTFGDSLLNFGVNIYDGGNLLSIVVDSSPHGTHVAGIVSAYFADQPSRNGLAPGAKIVSVKIGHPLLGGMETGGAIVRGLSAVVRNKCDLVNMSYGEPTSTPDQGRLTKLIADLVDKHNVIFVASAGNSGPALTTVGSPGGTTSAVLGVGAYVSKEMMRAEYAISNPPHGMPYTWTSRGPTADGHWGVDIFAPGGAISPVARWTLSSSMRMNGTSMASPSACGAIALLVSGLKANKIEYTPYSVRRAIQNTAKQIAAADRLAQGPGLIDVPKAFESLVAHQHANGERVRFSCRTTAGQRGIYLREPHSVGGIKNVFAIVKPVFPEGTSTDTKASFKMPIELEATTDWLSCGEFLDVTHSDSGHYFSIKVDSRSLSAGIHFGEVRGYEAGSRERGALFRLPVTVVVPHQTAADSANVETLLTLNNGQLSRQFVNVPVGASTAEIKVDCRHADPSQRFVLHAVQLAPGESFEKIERRQYFSLSTGKTHTERIRVTGGLLLEVCLGQYWSSHARAELGVSINFGGVDVSPSAITLTHSQPAQRVLVAARVNSSTINPRGQLTKYSRKIMPKSAIVTPLDASRDVLADGSAIYQLDLTYEFHQAIAGNVTLKFPWSDDLLYDSPLDHQLGHLYDSAGRRIATYDMWPTAKRLGVDTYTYQLALQHSDFEVLDRLKKTQLVLERPLPGSIPLVTSKTRAGFITGQTSSRMTLDRGASTNVWIGVSNKTSLHATLRSGDVLTGSISFVDGANSAPGGYPVSMTVDKAAADLPTKPADSPRAGKSLEEDLFAAKMTRLRALNAEATLAAFNKLADQILKERPNHMPVLVEQLKRLDDMKHRKTRLDQVVAAADAVIKQIDTAKLIAELGKAAVTRGSSKNASAVKNRDILIDALYRKGRALGYMELPDVIETHPIKDRKTHDAEFESTYKNLAQWVDTTTKEYFLLNARRERRASRFGQALKLINKHAGSSPPNYWYFKKRRDIYEQLGWGHLHKYESKWLKLRFPQK